MRKKPSHIFVIGAGTFLALFLFIGISHFAFGAALTDIHFLGGAAYQLISDGAGTFNIVTTSTTGGAINISSRALTSGLFLDTSNNVGVGTSTPASRLHVVGTSTVTGNLVVSGGITGTFTGTNSGATLASSVRGNGSVFGNSYDTWGTNYRFNDATNTALLYIDAGNGRVGVGTASPSYKFHVVGDGFFEGDGSVPNAPTMPGFGFGRSASDNNRRMEIVTPAGGISYIDFTNPSVDYRGRIYYDTASNFFSFHTNTAERMRINSAGNVGIGTTTPAGSIHVEKNVSNLSQPALLITGMGSDGVGDTTAGVGMYLTHNGAGNRQFFIGNSDTKLGVRYIGTTIDGYNNGARADLFLGTETNGVHVGTGVANTQFSVGNVGGTASKIVGAFQGAAAQSGDYLQVRSSGAVSGDILTLTSGGSLGVGATSPGAKLEVSGAMNLTTANTQHYYNVANFSSGTGPVVGTMVITLPKYGSNTMMQIRISGYDYSGGRGAWELLVGGYNYGDHNWYNTSLEYKGTPPFSQVRLANNGVNDLILLGTTATSWAYPKVTVNEIIVGHQNITGWGSGWSMAITATEPSLFNTVSLGAKTFSDAAGNIGIGNVSPTTARLVIVPGSQPSIDAGSQRIINVAVPVSNNDAANKTYVDSAITAGSTSTIGSWTNNGANIYNNNAGNVGIGTSTPTAYKLQVAGSFGSDNNNIITDGLGNISALSFVDKASPTYFLQPSAAVSLKTAGKVGIGMAGAPVATLDVNGIISSVSEYRFNNASYSRLAQVIPGDGSFLGGYNMNSTGGVPTTDSLGGTSGYHYAGDGSIRLFANGSQAAGTAAIERVRVIANGNVGIGTTTPATALSVVGNLSVSGNIIGTFTGTNSGATLASSVRGNGSVFGISQDGVGTNYQFNTSSTTSTALLMIDAGNGRVGVGTQSPTNLVDIYDSRNSGTITALRVQGVSTGAWSGRIVAGGPTVAFLMGEYNTKAWLGAHNAALNAWSDFYINPDGLTKLYLGGPNVSGPIVTVDNATRNVGIATTTPAAPLHVFFPNGTTGQDEVMRLEVGGTYDGNFRFKIGSNSARGGRLQYYEGNTGYSYIDPDIYDLRLGSGPSGGISFLVGASQKMYLSNAGALGIGTSTPSSPLTVIGNSNTVPPLQLTANNVTDAPWINFGANGLASPNDKTLGQITNSNGFRFKSNFDVSMIPGATSAFKILDSTAATTYFTVLGSTGNIGISTTTPTTARLVIVPGSQPSIDAGSQRIINVAVPVSNNDAANKTYVDSAILTATSSGTWNTSGANIYNGNTGNVGVGTTTAPSYKFQVFGTLGADNAQIFSDGTGNLSAASFIDRASPSYYLQPSGAVSLKTAGSVGIGMAGSPVSKLDVNGGMSVGSYAAINAAPSNGFIVSGNVGIGTSTPGANALYVNGATLLNGTLNMNNNNISSINKLSVAVIDPLYNIGGKNYSTYAASIAGSIREEYVGRGKLIFNSQFSISNQTGEMTKTNEQCVNPGVEGLKIENCKIKNSTFVLDFSKVEYGSDLWLWYQAVDFSRDNVEVLATAYGVPTSIAYEINGTQIVFRAHDPVEFSYRLIGKRYDWKAHPTFVPEMQKEYTPLIIHPQK